MVKHAVLPLRVAVVAVRTKVKYTRQQKQGMQDARGCDLLNQRRDKPSAMQLKGDMLKVRHEKWMKGDAAALQAHTHCERTAGKADQYCTNYCTKV